jgi:hypothetical protein
LGYIDAEEPPLQVISMSDVVWRKMQRLVIKAFIQSRIDRNQLASRDAYFELWRSLEIYNNPWYILMTRPITFPKCPKNICPHLSKAHQHAYKFHRHHRPGVFGPAPINTLLLNPDGSGCCPSGFIWSGFAG